MSSRHKHCCWQCRFKDIAKNFDQGDTCWEWPLSRNKVTGYGQFNIQANPMILETAHRTAFAVFKNNGEFPALLVRHTCDNRGCFNPSHLLDGTDADNMRDMWERDRQRKDYSDQPKGEDHLNSKLTDEAVRQIRSSTESTKVLAERLGVSKSAVVQVKSGRTWKHI